MHIAAEPVPFAVEWAGMTPTERLDLVFTMSERGFRVDGGYSIFDGTRAPRFVEGGLVIPITAPPAPAFRFGGAVLWLGIGLALVWFARAG